MGKIVQTLWTGQKCLVENSFGWREPQYHLMAWALSCLMLKENYENVEFYTDSEGAKVLIDRIGLPYTDVKICYDNLNIPEPHWAYSKMLTYSMQEEPFIHVDGDIFISKMLAVDIDSSGLIAQNEEFGTDYYKNIMDGLHTVDMKMPEYLHAELANQSIGSYNAGVLGGCDIDFIQRYCENAFRIIKDNGLDDVNSGRINGNYNLMFEQILFYAMVKVENKNVTTLFGSRLCDNGYTYNDFCDFLNVDHTPLLHLLGGHKRNMKACLLLAKTLLDRYPDYFWRIADIFGNRHPRLSGKKISDNSELSVETCIARYSDWLEKQKRKWNEIPLEVLKNQDEKSAHFIDFFNSNEKERGEYILAVNPYMEMFSIPAEWPVKARLLLMAKLYENEINNKHDIACVPTLVNGGYRETPLNDMCFNILAILRHEQSFSELCESIKSCVSERLRTDKKLIRDNIMDAMELLMITGVVYVKKKK